MTKKSDWKPTQETLDELDREAASLLANLERKHSKPKKYSSIEDDRLREIVRAAIRVLLPIKKP